MDGELKRRRWIVRQKLAGESTANVAVGARCSEASVHRWWRAYQTDGWDSLRVKSRRPHSIHRVVDKLTIRHIVGLRERYGWGPTKIEGYIREHKPEQVKPIGHNAIYRILCENNLNQPIDQPRKTWGKKRFTRTRPNALWQADFKLLEDDYWMLTYMDDYSRFLVGSSVMWNPTTENALRLFKRISSKHGLPEQLLTDRGTQFYCSEKTGKEQSISQFTQALTELGVKHIVASVRRPTTTGKIESFHKYYQEEIWITNNSHPAYIRYWNYYRPHGGIGYKYPSQLYYLNRVSDL